jgi:hypothetical protein
MPRSRPEFLSNLARLMRKFLATRRAAQRQMRSKAWY